MFRARPLALALSAVLVATAIAPDAQAQRSRRAAPKAPPVSAECTDFYTAINQDWLETAATAGSGSNSALAELSARARQQQLNMLNEFMQSASAGVPKLLGDFWASGLDESAVERDGANPIAPLLQRIDSIRRERDIAPAVAALHEVGIPVLFDFSARPDMQHLTTHMGYFEQGGLGLPDPAWYTRGDADSRALFQRYGEYVKQILVLTGTPEARVDADAAAVIDLETRIAHASRPLGELRDPRSNYAPVPVANFARQFRRLRLADFLQVQGVQAETVSMANPELFTQLDTLMGGLRPDVWKAYLRFHVGAAMAPHLSKPWRDVDFAFRGRVLRGETEQPARQHRLLDAINLAAGPMLGREYAARQVPAATKARAETIAAQVRDALGRAIQTNTWMDNATRTQAMAKLAALRIEIATPDADPDYSIQPMGRGSFGSNMLIASTWRHYQQMQRIGRENVSLRWDVLPQQPALAYDIPNNRLIITAAALQPPILDMSQDAASHYGSFGALVGHELGHGFDLKGRHVDAQGNVRQWWSATDGAAWEARANQVALQYNAFPYPYLEGLNVNGTLTRDENVADLAGLELALDAFANNNPEADDAARQHFFHGWARLWRQWMSPDVARVQQGHAIHAPGQWRTNGPLLNLPQFATAFGCRAGTGMAPPAGRPAVHIWTSGNPR